MMRFARETVRITILAVVAVGLLSAAGCDLLNADGSDGTATFRLLMTDAPFPSDRVEEANVTITDVQLISTTGNSLALVEDDTLSYNLLELRDDVTAQLSEEQVEAGTYSQIRLVVADKATLVDTSGTTYELFIPSGTQSGVKISLDSLEITPGEEVVTTLDFRLEESFVFPGNDTGNLNRMIFKPVVHLQSVEQE